MGDALLQWRRRRVIRHRAMVWQRRLDSVLSWLLVSATVGGLLVLARVALHWKVPGSVGFSLVAIAFVGAIPASLIRTWLLLRFPPRFPRSRGLG